MEENELKNIPGFPDYAITKAGRIWSKVRKSLRGREPGRWLTNTTQSNGYIYTHFSIKRKQSHFRLANLVLLAFVGPCPLGMECRHLDGDKKNNHLFNLKWGTPKENTQDSIQHGTHCSLRIGENSNASRLSEQDVRLIFNSYHDGGYSQVELAQAFRVSRTHIHRVINKKTWGHLWN